jgi:hypothetical protein
MYQKICRNIDKAYKTFCGCNFSQNLWSFDVLAIPEIRNIAASASAVANIVILSMSGKKKLRLTAQRATDISLPQLVGHFMRVASNYDPPPHRLSASETTSLNGSAF